MKLHVNTSSRLPIYQQLGGQIREAIARGELKPEDKLPSVRELSRELVVNPNTVARTYLELSVPAASSRGRDWGCSSIGRRPI